MPRLRRVKTTAKLWWSNNRLCLKSVGAIPFLTAEFAEIQKRDSGWGVAYTFTSKTHFSVTREGAMAVAEDFVDRHLVALGNKGRHVFYYKQLGKF